VVASFKETDEKIELVRKQADEAETLTLLLEARGGEITPPPKASAPPSSEDSAPARVRSPRRERPDEHYCSITVEVMEDPVMVVSCGDTFERSAIERWFQVCILVIHM
jgi:hypothetical protein